MPRENEPLMRQQCSRRQQKRENAVGGSNGNSFYKPFRSLVCHLTEVGSLECKRQKQSSQSIWVLPPTTSPKKKGKTIPKFVDKEKGK